MYLKIINSSAKNTLILLDNLLNWAKAQTGQIRYKPQKTILSVIIREILEVSNSIAKLKSITLNYIHADEIEVYADLDMLKTILRNLISNAIKYTHSDGKIDVSAIQNQNNIDITVSDNGVGMSEETRNKLFNIDTNITTKGTQNEKGSGLGLMLCKEFVERHGGLIWVDSELGKGSVFVFSLPLDNIDM
jgi:signal transduction histidine kinase